MQLGVASKGFVCTAVSAHDVTPVVPQLGPDDSIQARGMAISDDGGTAAISRDNGVVSVYTLPTFEHLRTFSVPVAVANSYCTARKLCFTRADTLLVADYSQSVALEVSLTGDLVRVVGEGVIDRGICGIDCNQDFIVVSKDNMVDKDHVVLFDFLTGALVRKFGQRGSDPGCIGQNTSAVRLLPDGLHIIVAEWSMASGFSLWAQGPENCRLSVFTIDGQFVRCIGEDVASTPEDVVFAPNGDVILSDDKGLAVIAACGGGGSFRMLTDSKQVLAVHNNCLYMASRAKFEVVLLK